MNPFLKAAVSRRSNISIVSGREYLRSNLIKRVELSHLRLKLHYVHEVSQKLRQLPDRAASSALLADNGRPHLVRVSPLVRGKEVLYRRDIFGRWDLD